VGVSPRYRAKNTFDPEGVAQFFNIPPWVCTQGRIQREYQTTGVPETFVIGRDGRVRRRIIGAEDWATPANIAFLERLLAEPAR
jgi:hypothetical protein